MTVPTYNNDGAANPNRTLKQLRDALMIRLGYAAQVANPPPGMTDLLNNFLIEAQELLYQRYAILRLDRQYSWPLVAGQRFYAFDANQETATLRIDPAKIRWAGAIRDSIWYPLEQGIPPEAYTYAPSAWPLRYAVRDAIEVWPAPSASAGTLVLVGEFGLQAFANDTDQATVEDRPLFLLALSNAKAHYGKPDADRYLQQMEVYIQNRVRAGHGTKRYIPGEIERSSQVYVQPVPTVPFA